MHIVRLTLCWIFAAFLALLTVSMLLLHHWVHALVLFPAVLLCLPPAGTFLAGRFGWSLPPLLRGVLIAGLLFLFVGLIAGTAVTSVYKSPEIKARFARIYDEKMREWPVPYEDLFVETRYGTVHVIASGPKEAPPLLLLHASGIASWSWKYNVEALSRSYRTYAVDLIGDAGKSEYTTLKYVMKTGRDQAGLYAEISDRLGIKKAYVAGASEGGFIGTNYALYHPERVTKLVLLGPMGYAGAAQAVLRIMFAQFFPLRPVQESTFRWAFSDDAGLEADFGTWFRLYMRGYNPAKVAPLPFSKTERQRLNVPVLFVFGRRDHLVGDPEKAKALVQDIPGARVEIIDAGHLMGAEKPERVNALITAFFGDNTKRPESYGENP